VRGMTFRLWRHLPAVLLLLRLMPSVAAAEFSPAAAEARAVRSNPDLAAARLRIEEARGRLWGSGRRPNPELQVETENNTNAREGSLRVGFVQKYPKVAKLWQERHVSEALLAAAEAEVRVAERQTVLSVRQLVVKALALDAQEALRSKQIANAKELAEFSAKRAKQGEGSSLEASQLELEAAQLSVETLQLQTERAAVLGELRPLLGLSAATPLKLTGALAAPAMPGAAPSPQSRPEYEAARQNELAAQRSVELERMRRRDDLSAGFFAGVERSEDAPDGLQTEGLIGFRLSIPLPFWNKNEGKIYEASAAAARLSAEKDALAQRLHAESAAARARMQAFAALVTEIDARLLPRTAELEEKLRASYQTGQTPLTDVLRAREKRLQLERTRLDALRDFHLVRAMLGLGAF
jgi:cobalt-zinc-cadmium efflux system outer membrane protein